MDKKSLMAIALITIVVMIWLYYTSVKTQHEPLSEQRKMDSVELAEREATAQDTATKDEIEQVATEHPEEEQTYINKDSIEAVKKYGVYLAPFANKKADRITIETDLVTAVLSEKGASLVKWELKEYDKWDGYPTQLIWSDDPNRRGELFLRFITKQAKTVDTRDLTFEFQNLSKNHYRITGGDSLSFIAKLQIAPDKYIQKKFTFYGDKYIFDNAIEVSNLTDILTTRGYDYVWSDGLRYQEKSTVDESDQAEAMASLNDELLTLNADEDEPVEDHGTGLIDYAGVKIKYFGAAIIPQPYKSFDGTVDLTGTKTRVSNDGIVERYDLSFRVPYDGGKDIKEFKIFIGPLDYDRVDKYALSDMMYFGWGPIRYIGEYLILPFFHFVHLFISSWGLTIIVFSVLMKIVLYPLSVQQMRSAQKMKLLNPEMDKIRKKYKDDQQKQQKETMQLYSKYGINPASGCLPLLVQMPILFALWSVLRTAIDLRQADFIFWINDLSQPDALVTLPFPFLGIQFLSGLALLMGITMFIQQKLTITDPRQKALVYVMPIMFTLIFSNLPSGLNLYYFVFNLMGIGQQIYINKFSKKRPTLEDLKKAPKKEGWFQKKMREAQEMAEKQGKSMPGKAGSGYKRPTKKKPPKKRKK